MTKIDSGIWVLPHPSYVEAEIKAQPVLAVGRGLMVRTLNTIYIIRKVSEDAERCNFTIQGHPKYCPVPCPCHIHGSTWGGSMLKVGYVGRGMHLEMWIEGRGTVTTSAMEEVEEVA